MCIRDRLRTDVAAVCNLEADALAAAEAAQLASGTCLAVMNDARMQEAYSALYEVVEGPRGCLLYTSRCV